MDKIILAFQGSGKSFAAFEDSKLLDLDFKTFDHTDPDWVKHYTDEIEDKMDNYDHILCNISKDLMDELTFRGHTFTVFSPIWEDTFSQEDENVEALILGRTVLRKTQNERNVKWLEKIKRHYKEWTKKEFFKIYEDSGVATIIPLTLSKNTIKDII